MGTGRATVGLGLEGFKRSWGHVRDGSKDPANVNKRVVDGQRVINVGSCREYPKLIFGAGGRTGCCSCISDSVGSAPIMIRSGIPNLIDVTSLDLLMRVCYKFLH